MAAPRNDKERARIYSAAMELFAQNGYSKTTYSDIARICGMSKSMIQYYFPKKIMFVVGFLEAHLESIAATAREYAGGNPLKMFCSMGIQHYAFMLDDGPMRAFCDDILASRELTNTMVESERDWARKQLDNDTNNAVSIEDILTVSLGGAYELIFQARMNGKKLEPAYVERAAFLPFALVLGYSRNEVDQIIKECCEILGF